MLFKIFFIIYFKMMEKLEAYFFGFFETMDNGWKYLTSDLIKKADFNYKENVMNHIKYFENRMSQYNPIAVLIGTILIFLLVLYFLRFFRKIWKKISN